MKHLDRYIFRETLVPTLIALLVLTFFLFSRQLGTLLVFIVRQSATMGEIWTMSAAILPTVLSFTIPMAVLVGILTAFGRMSSDSETIAFRAAGVPMGRLLRPVLMLALLAWAVNLALTLDIAPRNAARLRDALYQIGMKNVALELRPRVFNEELDGFVLYVQDAAPGRLEWRGILLADVRKPDDINVTLATSGRLVRDEANRTFQLTLTNGNTHIVAAQSPDRYTPSGFATTTFAIPMPQRPESTVQGTPAEMASSVLFARVMAGAASYDEQVEFHRRLALPFACLSFSLIGLALGVTTTRGGKSMGLVVSVILMLAYYLVFIGGTRVAAEAGVSPLFGTWTANIGFAAIGMVLLARSDREHENRLLARVAGAWERVRGTAGAWEPRRLNLSKWAYALTHHPKFLRLLDIYVLRGFWFFFILILTVFVALFIIVTLFELLPDIVRNDVEGSVVINYFIFLTPQILYWVLPLTVLLAILINLGTLTKTNEILAVKAGAVSLYRMALPLVLMALLLSIGVYLLQDFVLPGTNQRQDQYRNIIKGRAPQTYRDPFRKWMVGSDGRVYHYNYFDPNLNQFAGIHMFTLDPESFNLREWVFAARAEWTPSGWMLHNGWVRKLKPDAPDQYEAFTQRPFPALDAPDYFKKEVRTAAQMTYAELQRYVDDLQRSGFDVGSLTVDLHRKLSFPLVSLIMALIGVPFSFKTGKRGAFYGIGLCIVVGIVYWATFELFDKLGGINRLSPLIAAWFPNLIFGLSGLWMMLRVKT